MTDRRHLGDDELLALYAADRSPEHRAEIVERFYWIVEHVTRRYQGRGEPADDIAQVAALGLLGALDRYDPSVGTSFPSFAIPTAMGEVRRHFRDRTWRVRVPRRLKDLAVQVNSVTQELRSDLGREPSHHEVADRLGVSAHEVGEVLSAIAANRPAPTDVRDSGTDAPRVIELRDQRAPTADETDERMLLVELVKSLPERERLIIELCYFRDHSQDEVAAQLGISQPHVSRLMRASIAWMRDQLVDRPAG
ncbi:MAG: sigma-70 family RNA polymerase sigma factor [Acidimicrobiales bacterium]